MDKFICHDDQIEGWYVIHFSYEPAYKEFYKWVDTIVLEDSYSDFPRDYIMLSEANELVMLEKFGNYINEKL